MPIKTCPECGAQHGARKLVCDCGHDFGCKRTGKAALQTQLEPTAEPIAEPVAEPIAEPAAEPIAEPAAEPVTTASGKRGKKICPQCNAEHGARKLVCECGYDFGCKRSGKAALQTGEVTHALYPEPGAWVVDKMKGLPDVTPPEPLPRGPVSAGHVKEIVSYEGLGFAIYSHVPSDRISDPELRRLWTKARAAMKEIVEYLEGVKFPE